MLKIALAQLDSGVGAFESNFLKIEEAYRRACSQQARLLLTPELSVCGYPLYDLMDRPEMFVQNEKVVQALSRLTLGQKCALIVGHVVVNPTPTGRAAQNVLTVLENGQKIFQQAKTLLPTYDVFDEARYFEPAQDIELWNCDGQNIALAICEDLWSNDLGLGRRIYSRSPVQVYQEKKANLILASSSSPYEWNKRERRESLHCGIAQDLKVPLIYVNQVGATDEILFDGASFVLDEKGQLVGRLPSFRASSGIVKFEEGGRISFETPDSRVGEKENLNPIEVMSRGLVVGIRDYFKKTGFKSAILGLSGGIDSAVVATLAVQALGSENVKGVGMPSQYSSPHSLEDAEILAKNLGIRFEVHPIKFLFSTASRELSERRGQLAPVALENLQSRLRGMILMTFSNHDSSLVLTTGNKSELAMGYCTQYGDMVGALAPIGDLFKTRVYELARHLNQTLGNPIPERSLTKAPSAELRLNQTDQDSLPPYEYLDRLLFDSIEENVSLAELETSYGAGSREIMKSVEMNEYKRRQAAPVLKISSKAFGVGRRLPIAKNWEPFNSESLS